MGRCHLDLGEQVDLENMAFTRMARGQGFATAFQDPVSSAAVRRTKSSRFSTY